MGSQFGWEVLSLTTDNEFRALFRVKLFRIKAVKAFSKSSVSLQFFACELGTKKKQSILKMKFLLVVFAALLAFAAVSARNSKAFLALLN